MTRDKKTILFVGSFKDKSDTGHVGGQMFACTSLINSRLSDKYCWLLIDSTAKNNTKISFLERTIKAARRVLIFFYYLCFKTVDYCLIFTDNGWSFIEKGFMAILANLFSKKIILAPRSGYMPDSIENSKFFRSYFQYVIRRTDKVLCQGKSWKEYFMQVMDQSVEENKFEIIPNWIHADQYLSLPKVSKQTDTIMILFIGWIKKEKGVFDLLTAAKKIVAEHKNVIFVLGGDGEGTEELNKRIHEENLKDKFILKGWVIGDQKLTLLSEADIFVLPSYFEGFPNSVLEAMASGLPVITTTVGSIPDFVENNHSGLLFEAGDVDHLYNDLSHLISDSTKRKKLGQNAQNNVLERNTINAAVNSFEVLFESLG